jgi:isocitrate/isopropylmalate dehydrogenase
MSALSSASVRILVMEGDGIGPEITAATMAVVRAADDLFKLGLSLAPVSIGLAALRAHGTTLPATAVEAAKAADGVILGPVSHNDYPPVAQGGLNPSGELRKRLDLFANIRPARSRGGLLPRCGSPVDLCWRWHPARRSTASRLPAASPASCSGWWRQSSHEERVGSADSGIGN